MSAGYAGETHGNQILESIFHVVFDQSFLVGFLPTSSEKIQAIMGRIH